MWPQQSVQSICGRLQQLEDFGRLGQSGLRRSGTVLVVPYHRLPLAILDLRRFESSTFMYSKSIVHILRVSHRLDIDTYIALFYDDIRTG